MIVYLLINRIFQGFRWQLSDAINACLLKYFWKRSISYLPKFSLLFDLAFNFYVFRRNIVLPITRYKKYSISILHIFAYYVHFAYTFAGSKNPQSNLHQIWNVYPFVGNSKLSRTHTRDDTKTGTKYAQCIATWYTDSDTTRQFQIITILSNRRSTLDFYFYPAKPHIYNSIGSTYLCRLHRP